MSGKTTINAALTRAWALTQEAPNEILILANDREQALSGVFAAIEGMIQYNEPLRAECEVQSKAIYCATAPRLRRCRASTAPPWGEFAL
jgi:phage terminase large subunit-like protein